MADRVSVAKELGLHPQLGPHDVVEGEHYTVLAYTDWCDQFVPTIVKWVGVEGADDLRDADASRENKQRAREAVAASPA